MILLLEPVLALPSLIKARCFVSDAPVNPLGLVLESHARDFMTGCNQPLDADKAPLFAEIHLPILKKIGNLTH